MSGIYIKGMEMPKDGSFEVLVVHDNGIVTKGFFPNENEHTKAIFIPDHGDLIDRDMVLEKAWDVETFVDAVRFAPTIIPADKDGADDV